MVVWGSTRTMAFSSGRSQCCRLVEIVDDDTPFEAIDHAVAEADGDDCCPHWGGRAGQLGGHGGQDALHPVCGDGDVDRPVAVHVDQHRPNSALAHGGKDQGDGRGGGGLVDDARIGGEGQVPDVRPVGPTGERGQRFGTVTGHQHIEPMVDELDAHHVRWCHTGDVGGVAEQLGQVADPEHVAGPGVVAQLQLEIGERALRFRPGDAAAEGPPPDLPAPPAVQRGDKTDGGEAEEARAHGESVRCRFRAGAEQVDASWRRRSTGQRGSECVSRMVEGQRRPGWSGAGGLRGIRVARRALTECPKVVARVGSDVRHGCWSPEERGRCWMIVAPEPLLLETRLMDPGVPAAGEVTVGAAGEAAGEGACNGGDVAGTAGGAWVAPGMVSDHPG